MSPRPLPLALALALGCAAPVEEPGRLAGEDAGAPAGPDAGPAGVAPRVEVGTGVTDFQSLSPQGPIELVFGAQGGWHLDVTARLWGLDPEGLELTYQVVEQPSGRRLDAPSPPARLRARSVLSREDHLVRVGDRAFMDIQAATEAAGRSVELRLTATTPAGLSVSDTRPLKIVDEQR